jgi:hypothetical protein
MRHLLIFLIRQGDKNGVCIDGITCSDFHVIFSPRLRIAGATPTARGALYANRAYEARLEEKIIYKLLAVSIVDAGYNEEE